MHNVVILSYSTALINYVNHSPAKCEKPATVLRLWLVSCVAVRASFEGLVGFKDFVRTCRFTHGDSRVSVSGTSIRRD